MQPSRSSRNNLAAEHNYDPNVTSPYQTGPYDQQQIFDPNHPDYDPMIDPALQLRTVRTAAASIAESHRIDARREARKPKRRGRSNTILNKLGRGRTLRRPKGLGALIGEEFGGSSSTDQPVGAQGTGGEGVGVSFESAQQGKTPLTPTTQASQSAEQEAQEESRQKQGKSSGQSSSRFSRRKPPPQRRNVFLNTPLPLDQSDGHGEPLVRYPRNRVKTSKYNVVSFLPKFLYEQFHRLANCYFLGLVVIQIPSIFGATVPQIAMLPLVSVLGLTAIKDGIEDSRRHKLDNEVNNTAVTKLIGFRNVNQPKDGRTRLQKFLGLSGRGEAKISKGVRKLREKEDAIGMNTMRETTLGKRTAPQYAGPDATRTESQTSGGYGMTTILSEAEDRDSAAGDVTVSPRKQAPILDRGNSSQTFVSSNGSGPASRPGMATSDDLTSSGVIDYRRATAGTAQWARTLWKKLEVGDIVLLREDDQVPADIVVLNSSGEDGIVFVETKNLDGETNLKPRRSLKATRGLQSEEDIEHAQFWLDVEPPHANLYSFNALFKYNDARSMTQDDDDEKAAPSNSSAYAAAQSQTSRVEPVTINELLLRGCAIRNTDWVIGIVAFTGADTKIMLNSGETPSKRSKIEKETNYNVLANFVLLLSMCVICAVVGGAELDSTDGSRAFYEVGALDSSSNIVNALIIFGSCLVVFQNIVPISLYISIELVKTIQAFFIFQDIDMYYAPLDLPCLPKTWNISDDLGQIEYIFSDKTGTLTQNKMEFKKCSINGVSYGEGITEAQVGAMKREGKDVSGFSQEAQSAQLEASKKQMVATLTKSYGSRYLREDRLTLISTSLADDLAPSSSSAEQRRNIVAFFRALALCHTALTCRPDGDDPFILEYKAESPDEAALVAAARDVGAVFVSKTNHQIDIEVMGQPERYAPLKILEFNSSRKRMSVIVREPEGRILMICKGADSVIYQRLRQDHSLQLKEETQRDLDDFANAGLRTLCIAYRYIEEGEYTQWAAKFDEAAASTVDRDDKIEDAAELIEHDLTLLGATALEDKLQEGVPESIAQLHEAGIKLWVLTGDKMQTAIEIGFSCNLLNSDTEIMIITAEHEAGTRAQIEAACNTIAAAGRPVLVDQPAKRGRRRKSALAFQPTEEALAKAGPSGKTSYAVVIDGDTLRYALDPALKPLFLALTTQCETVVCCRVSPAQKALTVKLVKDGKQAMTLAIGDGANDVSMIQEAHCGVGIAGVEGAQASMSADYAIGQFAHLTKLLLVHGHWSYVRIAEMHKVFFYKNAIWTMCLFWYQIFCNFNATYIFDYTLVLLFNLVFTSLPVIVLGALDQDCNSKALLAFPSTYKRGIQSADYTRPLFFMSMLDGVYQSLVCFFVPWACWYYFPVVSSDGHSMDNIWMMGTTVAAGAIISANLYAGLAVRYWTVIVWLIQLVSILSFFLWISVYSYFNGLYTSVAYWVMSTVVFWSQVLLIVLLSLLPRFFAKAWRVSFMPNQVDLVREAWIRGDLKQRLGLKDAPDAGLTDVETGPAHGRDSSGVSSNGNNGSSDSQYQRGLLSGRPDIPQRSGSIRPMNPPSGQASTESQQNGVYRDGQGTRISWYDPDMLPGQAGLRTPEALGQEAFGSDPHPRYQTPVPQINIQRASDASSSFYPYRQSVAEDTDEDDEVANAATSRIALVEDVGSSASRSGAAHSSPPHDNVGPSAWHQRFNGPAPPPILDEEEYDDGDDTEGEADSMEQAYNPAASVARNTMRQPRHTDASETPSWHTAVGSGEHRRHGSEEEAEEERSIPGGSTWR